MLKEEEGIRDREVGMDVRRGIGRERRWVGGEGKRRRGGEDERERWRRKGRKG